MTNQSPLERASDALYDFGVKDSWLAAQAAFGSIDTDQLANVIEAYKSRGVESAGIAQVVKNYLAGENQ